MTIHFFTKGPEKMASARLRAFYVARYLRADGASVCVHEPSSIVASRTRWPRRLLLLPRYLRSLRAVRRGDVIFLQCTLYDSLFLTLALVFKVIARRKMVFDFDDAVFIRMPLRTQLLTRAADAVIVGLPTSLEWARRYNKNSYFVPTSVPFQTYSRYRKEYNDHDQLLIIGWVGTASRLNAENLRLLVPVFEQLIREGKRFRFSLLGVPEQHEIALHFRNILGKENVSCVEHLPWESIDEVASAILRFDVAVTPLVLNDWNKGKYTLKAIETMALGIPTIISATEGARCLVEHGKDGFLAENTEDWLATLRLLLAGDRALFRSIGENARQKIHDAYSLEAQVPAIKRIIKSV